MPPGLFDKDWDVFYIDGRRHAPEERRTIEVTNPFDRSRIARAPVGTAQDIQQAFSAATEAQTEWAERHPRERKRLLQAAATRLEEWDVSEILTAETGATSRQSRFQCGGPAVRLLENAADVAAATTVEDRQTTSNEVEERRPKGVVGVLTPWTAPFYHALRLTAVALATGNTVVIKPSERTPISGGLLVAELFEAVEAPPGLINVVPGVGSEAGAALADLQGLAVLAFAGSSRVARHVAGQAGHTLTQTHLNICGNNPHVVCADADLEQAVDVAVDGSFRDHGQVCVSINRHFVHESIGAEYVDRLVKRATDLTVGDPTRPSTDVGPMIAEPQCETAHEYIKQTCEEGATLECGGDRDGRHYLPTVLSGVTPEMTAAQNETFAPVAPVFTFDDDAELIDSVTAYPFGNVASIHTGRPERGRTIAAAISRQRSETSIGRTDVHVNPRPTGVENDTGSTRGHYLSEYNSSFWRQELMRTEWMTIADTHAHE